MNLTKIVRERLKMLGGAQSSSNDLLKNVICESNPCEHIASGNFGAVYKGAYQEEGKDCYKRVGLKVLKLANEDYVKKNFKLTNNAKINEKIKELNDKIKTEFDNEKQINIILKNGQHIAKFYGEANFPGDKGINCLVFEYYENKNLKSYLDPDPKNLDFGKKINILTQICEGMAFIHGKKVLHRDLAARNILLDKSLNAKVADFGLAVEVEETNNNPNLIKKHTQKGLKLPIGYLSPKFYRQYINKKNQFFSIQTDLWAFGVTIWEIFTKERPGDLNRIPRPYYNKVPEGENPAKFINSKILPKETYDFFIDTFKTNNKDVNDIIKQCFEPAFNKKNNTIINRTFNDLLTYINNIKTTGGSRKKKRTLKKGGRPKKQTKTRKSRK